MNTLTTRAGFFSKIRPDYYVLFLLGLYNVLGFTILGFNRSVTQVLVTSVACCLLQLSFDFFVKKKVRFPTSALITSFGLSILLNYGHNILYPLVPVFFAIGSKFFFTFKGKHIYNPALMGVVLSLLITNEFISPAPAYQWHGMESMAVFVAIPAMLFVMPQVNRHYIVGSFLFFFTIQIILRCIIMQHYLPFETLFWGTLSSPPFFLFCFFMITDPMTSPNGKKEQIIAGFWLAILDLFFHIFQSYHTFFYAAAALGTYKIIVWHYREMKIENKPMQYLKDTFYHSGYYKQFASILLLGVVGFSSYKIIFEDRLNIAEVDFKFERLDNKKLGFEYKKGDIVETSDPRVQHMAKWLTAITDGIAIADVNHDGLQDLLFANTHKDRGSRLAFYLNQGNMNFKRIHFDVFDEITKKLEIFGVGNNPMFVDYDNDGDKDLFITFAFGSIGGSRLFKNELKEKNKLNFVDVSEELGLLQYSNSATANFFDFNQDGKLDLIVGNTIQTHLPDYKQPQILNLFDLPKAEYEGDRRMFNFMHESWHKANNGGLNHVFVQKDNKFELLDSNKIGLPETRWSMAIGTADFNQDGYTDIYVANDFGADDFYINNKGKSFSNIKGSTFGTIGRDTYKGMNATIADFDRDGNIDVYVSNVHQPMQAEGSLLWTFKNENNELVIKEKTTFLGLLNENRFGWGASATDFNNDGRIDLAQANGMVDDKFDKNDMNCMDYWYINEKIARSSPDIHRYIDKWGDIRGMCIHGFEKNRLYIGRAEGKKPMYIDIADEIGMSDEANWRGMAAVDLDNDGRRELIATSLFRDPYIYKNKSLNEKVNKWIGLNLTSNVATCNKDAIGSKVLLTYKDESNVTKTQIRETTLVNGFSSQDDMRVHFGLGQAKSIEKLEIYWCLKHYQKYENLDMNKYHHLTLGNRSIAGMKK